MLLILHFEFCILHCFRRRSDFLVVIRQTLLQQFFALAAVVLFALAAIAGSKHFKKSEWDIIEESPEDV